MRSDERPGPPEPCRDRKRSESWTASAPPDRAQRPRGPRSAKRPEPAPNSRSNRRFGSHPDSQPGSDSAIFAPTERETGALGKRRERARASGNRVAAEVDDFLTAWTCDGEFIRQ